jgi:hypothetical protein
MNTYLLYDPALNGDYTMLILQQQYPIHRSLFAGTKDEGLDDVAPFIFQIDGQFGQKIVQRPLIELKASVFVYAAGPLEGVAAHFRPFIYQKLKGREFYFRFWDARVLIKFLPTCDKEQIRTFFENIDSLTMVEEMAAEEAQHYRHDHGRLLITKVPLSAILGEKAVEMPAEDMPSPTSTTTTTTTTTATTAADEPTTPVKKRRTFLS